MFCNQEQQQQEQQHQQEQQQQQHQQQHQQHQQQQQQKRAVKRNSLSKFSFVANIFFKFFVAVKKFSCPNKAWQRLGTPTSHIFKSVDVLQKKSTWEWIFEYYFFVLIAPLVILFLLLPKQRALKSAAEDGAFMIFPNSYAVA